MSKSHSFYLIPKIEKFPIELLDVLRTEVEKNSHLLTREAKISEQEICVIFRTQRPGYFHLTLDKERAMLNIRDAAFFSFVKYYNNKENALLIRLVLITKYFLKENFIVVSDDFEYGIPNSWVDTAKQLSEESYDIEIHHAGKGIEANFVIDGEAVDNEFDPTGEISKQMFTLVD